MNRNRFPIFHEARSARRAPLPPLRYALWRGLAPRSLAGAWAKADVTALEAALKILVVAKYAG